MTPPLESHAEILRLARLMGVDARSLEYLGAVPAKGLSALRESLITRFFDAHRRMFQRVASAARLLPGSMSVTVAQKVFGPKLSARIAGEMPHSNAVGMAMSMPIPFLADVSLEIDPHRARDLIQNFPVDLVVAIALELVRREEYVFMGRFVDHMTDTATRACVNAFEDETTLLKVGYFMETRHRFSDILRMLSSARLKKLLQAAHGSKALREQAEEVLPHLDKAMLKQVSGFLKELRYKDWQSLVSDALKKAA